jgi:hypothetical protein
MIILIMKERMLELQENICEERVIKINSSRKEVSSSAGGDEHRGMEPI